MNRILYLSLTLALLMGSIGWAQDAGDIVTYPQYITSQNKDFNPLYKWAYWIQNQVVSGGDVSAGAQIWYVDSGVAAEGDGTTWTKAFNTLQEAIDASDADGGDNRGDYIKVAESGGESLTGAVTIDVVGLTIEGCGSGSERPTYLYTDTDGALSVTVAGVTIRNLRLQPGIDAVVTAVSLAAGADYFTMEGCEVVEPGTGTFEFIDVITAASGTDYMTVRFNRFVSTVTGTGCSDVIKMDAGVMNRPMIYSNEFQGNFLVAAIHSSRACTNCYIVGNTVYQATTGQFGIEFAAAATGVCVDNVIWTDGYTTCLDPGSLACSGNMAVNTIDLSAIPIPALPAIGTVTAGSADDILKKLYYGSDGTGAYPATLANDSALAMLLAKGSTATPSTYSNTTDSLEALADHVQTLITTAAGTDVYPSGVTSDSVVAMILSKSATAAASSYNNTTDSLEALGDQAQKIDAVTLAVSPTAASLASFIASGGTSLGTQLPVSTSLYDVVKALYITAAGTDVFPSGVTSDSILAMIMAKGATATASTYNNTTDSLEAIADGIGAGGGAALTDSATTISGQIGVNDADNAMDTSTVVANADGSVYERQEYAQTMEEKCISKTITTIANGANNLFAVTGGPIKITEIVTYVTTTQIASEGCLVGYNIDPTTPATDTAFGTDGTAFECNAAAVGSALIWDGVLAADLTKATNGVAVLAGTDVSYGLLCPIGMIELTAAHDGTCAGEFTVYMRYMPLSPSSVVTAQ